MDLDIIVVVPRLAIAEIDLDHANPALDQTRGHKTPSSEIVITVALPVRLALFRDIENVRGFALHPVSNFRSLDAGFEVRVRSRLRHVETIQLGEQVELSSLVGGRELFVAYVWNQFVRFLFIVWNVGALINPRQEGRSPELGSYDWKPGAEHDESWEVLVFSTQAVGEP